MKKKDEQQEDLAGERRGEAFYAGVLCAGLEILAKRTEDAAKGDDDLHYEAAAAEKRRDVLIIRDGLVPRVQKLDWKSATVKDRTLLEAAGDAWVDTQRRLVQICGGLQKREDGERYLAELANVTKYLTPMLKEQRELFAPAA